MMGGSFSSQKSSQTPVNMNPGAFQALEGPFANVISQLLGGGTGRAGGPGTIYGPATGTPGAIGTRVSRAPTAGTGGTGFTGLPALNISNSGIVGRHRDAQGNMTAFRRDETAPGGTGQRIYMDEATGKWYPSPPKKGGTLGAAGVGAGKVVKPGTNPNDILSGIPYYQGPLTAALRPEEQELLDQLQGQATGRITSPSEDLLTRTIGGEFLPADMDAAELEKYINPFLQAQIEQAQRPTFQGLESTLSRTLPGRFTEAGHFTNPQGSSAFDREARLAALDAQQTAGDMATDLSFQTYDAERGRQFTRRENERGRQQQAAVDLPGVNRQEVDTTIEALKGAALPRLIEELGIERGMEEFNNRINNFLTTLGLAAGVTAPKIAQEGKSSGSQFGLNLK